MRERVITWVLYVVNAILAVILVLIILAPGSRAKRTLEVKVFYYRDLGCLPFWTATELGFFDSVGIRVSSEEVPKIGDEIDAVANGGAFYGFGFPFDLLLLKGSGDTRIRLGYLAVSSTQKPFWALLVDREAGIDSLKALTGHRIGYLQDTRQRFELSSWLLEQGVDTSGIKWVPMTTSEMATAFADKRCEALVAPEPVRSRLMADSDRIAVLRDGFLEEVLGVNGVLPVSEGFTSLANLKLRNEEISRITKALSMAIDTLRADPQLAQRMAQEFTDAQGPVNLPDFKKFNEIDPGLLEGFLARLKELEVALFDMDTKVLLISPKDLKLK